ncbi:MAG: hypothetical protein ABFS42_09850 [Candidatus Krumholzibacteriota bacterium]
MDFSACTQCGVDIESKGIHFRNKVFCSDECCEEYEAEFADKDEPVIDELVDEDLGPDDLEDDLGYRGDDDDDGDGPLDDDFDIKPEDF